MKQVFLSATFTLTFISVFSQNEKYLAVMKEKIFSLDTMQKAVDLKQLSLSFELIAEAEKDKWLPYYYASLAQVQAGYVMLAKGAQAPKIDPVCDKAEALLKKAEQLIQNNSEVYLLRKMLLTLRMWADPMNRYMELASVAQQALETAKKHNPDNPRILLIEAQDKFFTPEQFGGSKQDAKKLLEKSVKSYEVFKPADILAPSWGLPMAKELLAQCN